MNPIDPKNPMNLTNQLTRFGRFIFILLILLAPSMVYADWGDIFSRFQFYGIVQETYDNNVNLAPEGKKNDFITNVSLGLRFSTLPRSETTGEFLPPTTTVERRYGIYLDFLPGYLIYEKHTSDNYLSLSGNLDAWYTWGRNLTFRVRDYLIRSEEPLERNFSAGALPGQILLGSQRGRAIYTRNVAHPSLEYRFGREDIISVNYLNNVYRNRESSLFEDSTENYINPNITYWFDIRHGVLLEYALDLGNFQRTPDMTGNLGKGRYTYRFNPRTLVFGEYTFQRREFEKQVSIPTSDYDVHIPAIGFEHAFSPTLSLSAKFGYFWQIRQRESNETGPVYDIVITQRAQKTTYTLGFQGGYTEDYFTAQNLGFARYHQVIGTITHQLMERFAVTLSGRYQRPMFNDGRLDNIWGVTAGASYRILRWLTLGLDFSYAEDYANRDKEINNYTDFQGIFRITATY
jgi:hypothetical protein